MGGKAFATKNAIMVKDQEGNFINIREKLPFGSQSRIRSAAVSNVTQSADGVTDVGVDFGAFQRVLLEEGILSWGGEAFLNDRGELTPVSKTAIFELDPDWPLVQDTLTELVTRNPLSGVGSSPNSPSTSVGSDSGGSESSTESSQEQ